MAVLGGVIGGGLVAGERSLQRAVETIPAGDRVVAAVYGQALPRAEAPPRPTGRRARRSAAVTPAPR